MYELVVLSHIANSHSKVPTWTVPDVIVVDNRTVSLCLDCCLHPFAL